MKKILKTFLAAAALLVSVIISVTAYADGLPFDLKLGTGAGEISYSPVKTGEGEYTVFASDTDGGKTKSLHMYYGGTGEVSATYTNYSKSMPEVKTASLEGGDVALKAAIVPGTAGNEIEISEGTMSYRLTIKRILTISSVEIEDEEGRNVAVSLSGDGKYKASAVTDTVKVTVTPFGGYDVFLNGSASDTVALSDGVNAVDIELGKDGLSNHYALEITKEEKAYLSFDANIGDAVIMALDESGNRIYPGYDGRYAFKKGETCTYYVTRKGYKGVSGTVSVDSDRTVTAVLEPVPASGLRVLSSSWPFFGKTETNNMVMSNPTPVGEEEASLYWATKVGNGYSGDATSVPIIVDNYIYVYAKTRLYKIDKTTGEIIASGKMADTSSFAINSATYAEGMIFVGLRNAQIQAFSAETLESLWIYKDGLVSSDTGDSTTPGVSGGQPNCPIVYSDGYIYTGFWNGEEKGAHFVCVSIADEDPSRGDEAKLPTWYHTQKGGFYWAGAVVVGDYVYVGTDDGADGYVTAPGHLLSFEKETGKLVSDVTMPHSGDIRSSIIYEGGYLYFTSKGGYFYKAAFDSATGTLGAVSYVALRNYYDTQTPSAPAMSTSTPTIANGRAYVGVSGTGQFVKYSGHGICVIDLDSMTVAYVAETPGYPQTSGTLTTAYQGKVSAVTGESGYNYVYFFDNYTPGSLRVIMDKKGVTEPILTEEDSYTKDGTTTLHTVAKTVYTPTGDYAQYCICTPVIDEDGTLFFKNDSAYLMAVGAKIDYIEVTTEPDRMTYAPGDVFDPKGMKVTAYYVNGTARDVTDYVSYSTDPLKEGEENFEIRFEHISGTDYPTDVIKLTISGSDGFVLTGKEISSNKDKRKSLTSNLEMKESGLENTYFITGKNGTSGAKGGKLYVMVQSDIEYKEFTVESDGDIKAETVEFDPYTYKSTGTERYYIYSVRDKDTKLYLKKTAVRGDDGKLMKDENGKTVYSYEVCEVTKDTQLYKSSKTALSDVETMKEKLGLRGYRINTEKHVYIVKITVPSNYSVSEKHGTYKITAKDRDGKTYVTPEMTLVSDAGIFEYERVKDAAEYDMPLVVSSARETGYSDYLTGKLGYGLSYSPDALESYSFLNKTVVCKTAFRAVVGKDLSLASGGNVTVDIHGVAEGQPGVNFISSNVLTTEAEEEEEETDDSEEEEEKKVLDTSLIFYGRQQIMSDFTVTWDLCGTYEDLFNTFSPTPLKFEEQSVVTYYILKDGKYHSEFTVDYLSDDVSDDVVLTLENEAGSLLGSWSISLVNPDASIEMTSPMAAYEEENPETGAMAP